MHRIASKFVCFWLCVVLCAGAAEPFRHGDTVVFLGDSITHGGKWTSYVETWYHTRFPERKIRFVNAGSSGDTAGGALARLDREVLAEKPTAVVIMLGMNDVNRGLYAPGAPGEANMAARRKALDGYQANMTQLVEKIRGAGVARLILVTPSPYDQTAAIARENLPGVNDALAECGRMARRLAEASGGEVVDFNGPMTEWNSARQRSQPAFTLIGPDRVHPGPPGALLMAYLFLRAQSVPPLVSRVVLDAAAGKVIEARNAQVKIIARGGPLFSFEMLESALPFPLDPEASEAAATAPLERDLNEQTVAIHGLPEGSYRVIIDGAAVGSHSEAVLARGVSLCLPAAPQYRQAADVMALVERRRQLTARLRDLAVQEEKVLRRAGVDLADAAAVRRAFDAFLEKQRERKSPTLAYYEGVIGRYYHYKPQEQALRHEVARIEELLEQRRLPVRHLCEVERVLP